MDCHLNHKNIPALKIQTLHQFYDLMLETHDLRKKIVKQYVDESMKIDSNEIDSLKSYLDSLIQINQKDGYYILRVEDELEINLDLTYETEELRKDIMYLEEGEERFIQYLSELHNDFDSQVGKGVEYLKDLNIRNFITDRDGTVNNYCGRYRSSIQSIYNAVFLTRFAHNVAEQSIILTSAPLENIGLADISVSPDHSFIYAASKGREYLNNGQRNHFPIEPFKQEKLTGLNKVLSDTVKRSEYQKFALIGSGLQYKFGQTTIARQDVNYSIPEKESEDFFRHIQGIVQSIDPQNKFFRIEDTGKDIEIILTLEDAHGETRDFDKGDGVSFLNEDIGLHIESGSNLICGDTPSDVPMVKHVNAHSENNGVIFVTEDGELKNQVKKYSQYPFFVSTPDVLVTILNQIAII